MFAKTMYLVSGPVDNAVGAFFDPVETLELLDTSTAGHGWKVGWQVVSKVFDFLLFFVLHNLLFNFLDEIVAVLVQPALVVKRRRSGPRVTSWRR